MIQEYRFERDINHNYLVRVGKSENIEPDYQMRMVEKNHISKFLLLDIEKIDNRIEYYYDITSKQPLTRLFERRKIGSKEIQSLLHQIKKMLSEAEEYLLDYNRISLIPNMIYGDFDSFELSFCFTDTVFCFTNEIKGLLQYLLDIVDYEDHHSVALAYRLFQTSNQESVTVNDLLKCLSECENESVKERSNTKYKMIQTEAIEEEVKESMLWEEQEFHLDSVSHVRIDTRFGMMLLAGLVFLYSLICVWLLLINKIPFSSCYPIIVGVLMIFIVIGYFITRVMEEKMDKEEGFLEPEESSSIELYHSEQSNMSSGDHLEGEFSTVLLYDKDKKHNDYQLKSLFGGEGQSIPISSTPFIIGKMEGATDWTINNGLISRLHIKIEQLGSHFYVSDLNSTNGTFINGIPLAGDERREVTDGDEIMIANLRYRFEPV